MGASEALLGLFAAFLCILVSGVGLDIRAEETPFVSRVDKICGVDSYHAANTLLPCQARSASNVLFDEDAAAKMREGYVTYLDLGCSDSVRGMWNYTAPDGTDWLVALCSSTLYGYNGISVSSLLTGLDPQNRMDAVSALGNIWFVNRSTSVFYFNGTSINSVSGGPIGSWIETYRNRIVIGDVSGEQSTLYLSGELNGTDWTTGAKSTSPVTWRVGGVNDAGNRIKCLYSGFGDFLFVGTARNTWGFFGNDQRDFRLRELFPEVGCIDDGTVREHLGELTWVSNKGVERFDRNVLRYPRVSEPIRDVTDNLSSSASQELSWVQTSQADFAAGTHLGTTADIFPGSVALATWTATDTSDADFQGGTFNDTMVSGGKLFLSTNNANIDNYSFELGDPDANWTLSRTDFQSAGAGAWGTGNPAPKSGMNEMVLGTNIEGVPGFSSFTFTASILDHDGNELVNTGNLVGSMTLNTWVPFSIDLSAYVGTWVKIKFHLLKVGVWNGTADAVSDLFLCSGGAIGFWVDMWQIDPYTGSFYVDLVEGGRSSINSGTFTSRTFDTLFSSAAWISSEAHWTTNGNGTPVFQTQSSANGSSWESLVLLSTGSAPGSGLGRYFRYVVTLSTGADSSTALPYVEDFTVGARNAVGTFISQSHEISSIPTRWGNFEANQSLNGGAIVYGIRTASNVGALASAPWIGMTPFTTIAAATNTVVQYKADLSITAGTQDPTHNDATVFWRSGADRPAMFAEVFRDRWHLFYTTSTAADSRNEKVAPLDRNLQWTYFDGIGAASSVVYRNNFLVGDSGKTGKIYRLYSGYNDNGSAINGRITLRDDNVGDEDSLKTFDKLYVTMGHETEATQDVNINLSYTVDGSTESFSLGSLNLGESVGRINARIPFPVDGTNLNIGRWISPTLSWSALDAPVSLFGIRFYGWKEDVE